MMIFCTASSLLKSLSAFGDSQAGLLSLGYVRFSRLDPAQNLYHLIGSPIPRTT